MKIFKHLGLGMALVIPTAFFPLVAGCSAADDAPRSPTPGGESVAADAVPAKQLITLPYSKGGTIKIMETTAGATGFSVEGLIGQDDPMVAMDFVSRGLSPLYRQVFPGQSVPTFLSDLDAKLALSAANGAEASDQQSQDRSFRDLSSFCNSACVTTSAHGDPNFCWIGKFCGYETNWHSICTYNTINDPADGSFVWNDSSYTAKHTQSNTSTYITVAAYTWQWGYWSNRTASNQYDCLVLDGTNTGGNLGITWEAFQPTTCQHGPAEAPSRCD